MLPGRNPKDPVNPNEVYPDVSVTLVTFLHRYLVAFPFLYMDAYTVVLSKKKIVIKNRHTSKTLLKEEQCLGPHFKCIAVGQTFAEEDS